MNRIYLLVLLSLLASLVTDHPVQAQKGKNATKKESVKEEEIIPDKKSYTDIITKEAVSDPGLFTVHRVKEKFYFEIPYSGLNKDMLLVSRIARIPSGLGGAYLNAGSKIHEQMIRWELKYNKILIRILSDMNFAGDSLPISLSVKANNYEPILYSFDIETYTPDSTAILIDVTDFFTSDIQAISGLSVEMRKNYKVNGLDSKRSFIAGISSYPQNVEIRQELTYKASEPPSQAHSGTITMFMNQSMILLPEKPMMPRYYDDRVGWFTLNKIDYGSPALKSDIKKYIRRWRLEPSDPEAYARGELVEPVKPIIYYLDPATPEQWRPYFKAGVEEWDKVFESAGFKNAIAARDPPTSEEYPEFTSEDIRFSVIRYVASTTRNAMGPSVIDPRSGEIIESDIIWYHNHFRSYRNRYLIETGAANPSARTLNTDREEIGEMIKMVIAHEVGHALGLPHNMKASSAYPVDSLRSGSFTQKFGIAASIMDYARYNYVAQPGDQDVRFIRRIGPYDHYAINWGYRWIPDVKSPEEELPLLDQWIEEKYGDPVYLYGSGNPRYDPTAQTEDIGNDPVMASEYGLSNLQKIVPNLIEWTTTDDNGYEELKEIYEELLGVWNRYVRHVITNIGGMYETRKEANQEGIVYLMVPANIQRSSMEFLNKHAFTTPTWLIDQEILRRFENSGELERIRNLQAGYLTYLLNTNRLERVLEMESFHPEESYSCTGMMADLRKGIWGELYRAEAVDPYRRNLQHAYLDHLEELLYVRSESADGNWKYRSSDLGRIAIEQLEQLQKDLIRLMPYPDDLPSRSHFNYMRKRIDSILNRESR